MSARRQADFRCVIRQGLLGTLTARLSPEGVSFLWGIFPAHRAAVRWSPITEGGARDTEREALPCAAGPAKARAGFSRNMVSKATFLPFLTPFSAHSTVTQALSRLTSVITARWILPSVRWIATLMPAWRCPKCGFTGVKDERRGVTGRNNWLAIARDGGVSLETRPDSPGEPGMQPLDPCLPWRGILGPGHTPVFWPGESHGQRSLAGCSPWGFPLGFPSRRGLTPRGSLECNP